MYEWTFDYNYDEREWIQWDELLYILFFNCKKEL